MARIMTIDDDEDTLYQLRQWLRRAGHETLPLLRADRIVEEIRAAQPDLIITDVVMPGIMGGGVYSLVREKIGPHMPVIVSSGTRMQIKGGQNDPLLAYCPKPVDYDTLFATIDTLLEKKRRLEEKGQEEVDDFDSEH
jgi:DNA-binding NtrC family response regulator